MPAGEGHLVSGHQPAPPHAATSPHQSADLAAIVRLHGLRPWIEQRYKQIKDELGWSDFQVRSDRAIRRHQTLVNCAFSFLGITATAFDDDAQHDRELAIVLHGVRAAC